MVSRTRCGQPQSRSRRTSYVFENGSPRERADRYHFSLADYQGIVPFSQRVNVPVGPSQPSSATRTASRAPSSTVSVPAYPLRFVLVNPGETALTLIPSGSSSIAMATVESRLGRRVDGAKDR